MFGTRSNLTLTQQSLVFWIDWIEQLHFTKYYIRGELVVHISSEILIATNKIFQSPTKSCQRFWILFFLLGTSPDLIVQVHGHIQQKHLKKHLSYFQLVCLGLTYGVFRQLWYYWINRVREDVLFMYFTHSRSRNKLNFICCSAKSFKTMCSPNISECTFVSLLLHSW